MTRRERAGIERARANLALTIKWARKQLDRPDSIHGITLAAMDCDAWMRAVLGKPSRLTSRYRRLR